MGQAADVLGVSPDTVRRWIDRGELEGTRTASGRRRIPPRPVLARFAQALHEGPDPAVASWESARNHFTGIVTKVVKDKVMACGLSRPARTGW